MNNKAQKIKIALQYIMEMRTKNNAVFCKHHELNPTVLNESLDMVCDILLGRQ